MGHRMNVYRCLRIPVDGGKSPNAYVPQITVEIRVFWPPGLGHEVRVGDALTMVYTDALNAVMAQVQPKRSPSGP